MKNFIIMVLCTSSLMANMANITERKLFDNVKKTADMINSEAPMPIDGVTTIVESTSKNNVLFIKAVVDRSKLIDLSGDMYNEEIFNKSLIKSLEKMSENTTCKDPNARKLLNNGMILQTTYMKKTGGELFKVIVTESVCIEKGLNPAMSPSL